MCLSFLLSKAIRKVSTRNPIKQHKSHSQVVRLRHWATHQTWLVATLPLREYWIPQPKSPFHFQFLHFTSLPFPFGSFLVFYISPKSLTPSALLPFHFQSFTIAFHFFSSAIRGSKLSSNGSNVIHFTIAIMHNLNENNVDICNFEKSFEEANENEVDINMASSLLT